MKDEDFDLLRAWQGGDRHAGDRLLRRHFHPVFRFFVTKVGDEAEDLTQRTFLACMKSRDRVDPARGTFRAYLFGIAHKQLLMHLRSQRRSGRKHDEMERMMPLDSVLSPSRAVSMADEQRLLLRALRQLSLDHQIVLELFYWEGLRLDEIAVVLDIAVGTVKSRLGRSKAALRERIGDLANSDAIRQSTVDNLERWARSVRGAVLGEASEPI